MTQSAKLILKNGSCYPGYAFGALKSVSGEAVFNTGMVGYPETLSDPSYRGQILVLTYPLIGNYGVPGREREQGILKYFESTRVQVAGLAISDYSFNYSHYQAVESLDQWLKRYNVPGIYGLDTRALTKELRTLGTMPAKIICDNPKREVGGYKQPLRAPLASAPLLNRRGVGGEVKDVDFIDSNQLNLVKAVSIKKPIIYPAGRIKIVVIDCGIKLGIIRSLLQRNITVIRVPYNYPLGKIRYKFHGMLISNGPGDPKMCRPTIENIKQIMTKPAPILGICLGHQLLALAGGGDTYKLKFGHRGQNQPVRELKTNKCYITSQNHGYAVKPKLPSGWEPWFTNLNDGTIEGIRHKTKPWRGVQFHPEASPGPTETQFIFDSFISLCLANAK